jgi:hypothetical protein
MATFDLSAADKILKVKYLGPIREQLNNSTILMSRIMKDSSTINVGGKSFTVPVHVNRNKYAGSGRGDGSALPTSGVQGYNELIVPNKYLYATIEVTGPTIAATKGAADAFVTAVDSEINGAVRDMKRAMNRQMHSDGRDALGFLTAAVLVGDDAGFVDDNRGNAFVHFTAGDITVDLIDTDNTTKNGDSIDFTLGAKGATSYAYTSTINLTNAGADGDYWVLEDTLGKQMMGLEGIIDDGNPPLLSGGLHGINASTAANAWWKSQVFDASGTNRALTLDLMQAPLDAIASNSDYDEAGIKFLLCSYGVRAKYVSLLVAEKRFVNTMELDGGFKGVEFNGIPLVPDPQCKKNRIYYVNPEVLRIMRTSDFDWMDKDGAVLARKVDSNGRYDAYQATLFHYGDLACIARNALGLLDDITE